MRAVLISIQPKWCRMIISGKKTVEIRRSCPQMEAPFKVYIYCTLSGSNELFREDLCGDIATWNRENWSARKGNVIAEFTCSKVSTYDYAEMFAPPDWEESLGNQYYITYGDLENSCLSYEELVGYGQEKKLYGWNISELKIYDEPKPLSKLMKPYGTIIKAFDSPYIQRPPQSWCYVEEL